MTTGTLVPAASPPEFHIPPSGQSVSVYVIDSTTRVQNVPLAAFVVPLIPGYETASMPAYSFLIEHKNLKSQQKRRLVFDLGARKDWWNLAPAQVARIKRGGWEPSVEKNVAEILHDGGVPRESVEAVIWSHWHWDHTGDISTFPSSTDLIVGPGFKNTFIPGWPTKEDALTKDTDFENRTVREIDFRHDSNCLKIGRYDAVDFFGDGSFYLLDSPGHAIGQLAALARTTVDPPTYILMGADTCHHGGEIRPSSSMPLPSTVMFSRHDRIPISCPGALFQKIHPHPDASAVTPFYEPAPTAATHDVTLAKETISKIMEADAQDEILIVFAHDATLLKVLDFFPKAANEWKSKEWDLDGRWLFLEDFTAAIKATEQQ